MREQTTKKIGIGVLSFATVFSLIFTTTGGAFAATAPSLSTAATYGVLAGTSVTNTGNTVITGDLGVSPGNTVTGFPPGTVSGTTNAGNAAAATAQTDLTAAYTNAVGQACTATITTDLGGNTLTPGVHCFTVNAALTGTVTLNAQNDPNAIFIIKVVGDLTVANSATVALSNGALASNVYWQIGDSATIGTGATFRGTLMVLNDISIGNATAVSGRVLARSGAVTLTNNAITVPPASAKGTLIVKKEVINNNGGTKVPGDFTITVTGTNPSPATFTGSSTGTIVSLDSGSYHVDETAMTGYNSSSSSGCNGNISAGETVTCTITNDDVGSPPAGKGQLVVRKVVINDNGGTKVASDFTLTVSGTNPSPSSFQGSTSGTTVALDPGTYSVNEVTMSGYNATFSAGCLGAILAGETLNCTVTNNDIGTPPSGKGQLIVTKNVINDNGGNKVDSDFTINVTGGSPTPSSFPGNDTGTTVVLDPGGYSVDEPTTAGYTKSLSASCVGNIVAGETKVCTVTNNDVGPTPPAGKASLTVYKTVINDQGGTRTPSQFTINVTGSGVTPQSFPGNVNGTVVTLNPGTYSVTEDASAGYTMALGANCSGTITAGEIRSCVVTNNDISATPPTPGSCAGFTDVNSSDSNCEAYMYVSSIGAMAGNPNGTFAPNELVQRDQAAKIALLAFNRFNGAVDYCNGVNPFPDVLASDWVYQYVCRGKQIGMINGYASGVDAGLYRPARPVNRAEWLALLLRNVNETMPSIFSTSYTDVDSGQWFSGYARYSQMHDLFLGSRLYPAQYATRAEVAETLFKLHNEGKL